MANILILEETPCVRELISEALTGDGHRVDGFANREPVIPYLRSSRPDVVILEPQLQDGDGWHLLRHIKTQHPDLPVLLLAASEGLLDDPRASLADGCLKKSFNFTVLKQAVAAWLCGKPRSPQRTPRKRAHPSRVALTTGC
jgi:DNA-binding response OmpR family regulator